MILGESIESDQWVLRYDSLGESIESDQWEMRYDSGGKH